IGGARTQSSETPFSRGPDQSGKYDCPLRTGVRMNRACQLLALCGVLLLVVGCAGSPSGRHVDSQKAAEANANLGLDYLGKNQYEQAMHRFQRALQYDHDNRNANWGMALAYQHLDQPGKARSYYQRVLKQEPRPAML